MTLVTTPGDAAADSYATLAAADAYFTARGVTTWTGSNTDKEAALRRATTYLDNQYKWVGLRATQAQSLLWPRVDGSRDPFVLSYTYPLLDPDGFQIAIDAVPVKVQQATFEIALLALSGVTLEPRLERGGQIKSKSESVGPLSETTVWQDGAPVVDRYTVAEGLLRGYFTAAPGASSGNLKVVRG